MLDGLVGTAKKKGPVKNKSFSNSSISNEVQPLISVKNFRRMTLKR